MTTSIQPTLRREALRDALPGTLDMLHRRRACDVAPGYIDDYIALDWLEWRGGGLRVTVVGENICRQMALRTSARDTPQ